MIRHLMANVVRVEYVPPNHTDTYLVFDGGLSKIDLLGSALGTIKMNHDTYHESKYLEDCPDWLEDKLPKILPFIKAIQIRFEKLIMQKLHVNWKIPEEIKLFIEKQEALQILES